MFRNDPALGRTSRSLKRTLSVADTEGARSCTRQEGLQMPAFFFMLEAISALACAAIFHSRGRNPWGGALLGGLLGVIGILVAALAFKRRPATA